MTKTVKQSAIANITKTIVKPAKPVKVTKPSKGVVMLSDTQTLEAVNMYAKGIKAGEDSIQTINNALKMFHDKNIKLCKASEKTSELFAYSNKVRTMFVDSFVALGKKKSYIEKQMYPAFLKGVNSGKPIEVINTSQAKAQAKAKANKANTKANKVKSKESEIVSFNNALAKIVSSATSQAKAIKHIESKLDTMSLVEAIKDYLDTQDVKTK